MSELPTSRKTLLIATFLLTITFVAELIGGLIFGSLSLVSDSFHVLSDLTAILITSVSLTIAQKRAPTQQMAFGYHRLEVISALFNGLLLSAISAIIVAEAWTRFHHPTVIDTTPALVVAVLGLGINVIVASFFHRASSETRHDLNIRSAYLHILADALVSVSVIIGIIAIKVFSMPAIDPIVACFVSLLLLIGAGRVLYRSAEILLHKSPQDIQRVQNRVRQIAGVDDFVDVRLWQVCSHLTVGTAHVVISVKSLEEAEPIKKQIKSIIQDEFNVRDITLECETHSLSTDHPHRFQHEHD